MLIVPNQNVIDDGSAQETPIVQATVALPISLTLLRAARGHCSLCCLSGEGYVAEGEDGFQRLLCVPCLKALEPDRNFPTPFGVTVVSSPLDGWRRPPMAGSIEEYVETARFIGFGGGCGGSIGREE
jgi:hypothetical protein